MFKILVLTDSRAANTKQSTALANGIKSVLSSKIAVQIDTTDVKFNFLAKLPNIIRIWKLSGKISKPREKRYDVIISCGRKLAKISLHAKRKYGAQRTKIITILNPNIPFSHFDAVLLPKHDNILSLDENNVVNTNGAISYFNPSDFKEDIAKFSSIITRFHRPYISVAIGGNAKNFVFTQEIGIAFINQINDIAKKMDATLLITTSRRTPPHIIDNIKKILDCSYYLYDVSNPRKGENLYNAFLGYADYLIATADSISMICEMSYLQKPLYVYKDGINISKYEQFLTLAQANNSVKILDKNVETLENFLPNTMDCINDVAKDVLKKVNILFY
ncbi:ELM1/GtrOC1 family putative glycosyltransferase [Candidatus Deianiraea vastatrix]|uniref:Nucleoside-diphosphate sugar epimerase n=1 Tax=Candidatus Deianiraea vastatrix TaxID=2163644 RepID=A0A5B8XE94_9RICK|nr:ELM1/GtrOC1 family putative glycosyltransferase [Candidatus Deianiraea vastatrix]QED23560.1 Putative nucleoside-diphosphate sugar epimerase [Candidatus Deianiraea vastatrix]